MKMKEFGPSGGTHPWHPLRSATVGECLPRGDVCLGGCLPRGRFPGECTPAVDRILDTRL